MSDSSLATIIDAIDAALEGRSPAVGILPWFGWLTTALLRQRARQSWHRTIVDERLRDAETERGSGDVPELPGWTYYFHGRGCCLTGPDGERVDVDRLDEDARLIDPYFFAWRVATVRTVMLPEVRLWRWMPSDSMIVAVLSELQTLGAIVYPKGGHAFQLAEALEERVSAVAACRFDSATVREAWTSAFGDHESSDVLLTHRAWVQSRAIDPRYASNILEGAQQVLEANELAEVCLRLLDGQPGPAMGAAISALRERRLDHGIQRVISLTDELSTTDDPPYPAFESFAYLLENSVSDGRVVKRFDTFAAVDKAKGFGGNPFLGDYAVLALRFLPERAMGLVRRALRCDTPVCVMTTAELLAAIGQPWCERELRSALLERPNASTLANALRECSEGAEDAARDNDPEFIRTRRLAEEIRKRYPADWDGA